MRFGLVSVVEKALFELFATLPKHEVQPWAGESVLFGRYKNSLVDLCHALALSSSGGLLNSLFLAFALGSTERNKY